MLLLDAAGLERLFAPDADVGENVQGLLDHPGWEILLLFLRYIGLTSFQVHSKLSDLVPMARSRVFLYVVVELPACRTWSPQMGFWKKTTSGVTACFRRTIEKC